MEVGPLSIYTNMGPTNLLKNKIYYIQIIIKLISDHSLIN